LSGVDYRFKEFGLGWCFVLGGFVYWIAQSAFRSGSYMTCIDDMSQRIVAIEEE
jgi:hypothetical protein